MDSLIEPMENFDSLYKTEFRDKELFFDMKHFYFVCDDTQR